MEQADIERRVMKKILAGDHPSLAVLRAQYDIARVDGRDFSGSGFFTHYSVPAAAPRVSPPRLQLSDLHLELAGSEYGAGVILFIDQGVLETLEVYMWAEEWPAEPDITAVYYLHETPHADGRGYDLTPSRERDLSAMARGLRA